MLFRALVALGSVGVLGMLRTLWLLVSLTVAAIPAVHAEEQMAWTVDRYDSDLPENQDTVILSYGIPQTDAVAFEAICGGREGSSPRAVFWYDTLALDANQDVVLSLALGDVTETVPAKVFGKDAEVGVSGLQATLDTAAPIWQAMKNGGILVYSISGGQPQQLHLAGAKTALGAFTAACDTMASSGPAGAAAALTNDRPGRSGGTRPGEAMTRDSLARDSLSRDSMGSAGSAVAASILDKAVLDDEAGASAVSCEQFGTIKSEPSETPVQITFVNKADGYRGLVWIDTEGTPIDHAGLNQGESVVVATFGTHAWMITDGPGNCIEMAVAGDGDGTFAITVPAPPRGPEDD